MHLIEAEINNIHTYILVLGSMEITVLSIQIDNELQNPFKDNAKSNKTLGKCWECVRLFQFEITKTKNIENNGKKE